MSKRWWILWILCLLPLYGAAKPVTTEHVVFAGGCFWGMEGVFEDLRGVRSAVAGYAGGAQATAHYEMVSTGLTGHAESVDITYDPAQISFHDLLEVFFLVAHDPTELNRQGPDVGSQYRSSIFYTTPEQQAQAQAYIAELEQSKTFSAPIVTKLVPLQAFYPAEAYHQHFMQRNPDDPYIVQEDLPKIEHLRERFPQLVKTNS
ncbi:MAG TPA: peptide-methionine (S)-S-oxide reductase MsrA [Candidatus Acidoferrales bacterium]|nr:peptide-methionine (S)-S-oxide reductase MsrA [Candidatus Acidoferrales bacterium]